MTPSPGTITKSLRARLAKDELRLIRGRSDMRCDKSVLTASAHLDQELTQNEARNYQAHIKTCTECCAHLQELEQMSLVLKSARRLDTSSGLRRYVMSVITAE